MKTPQDKKALQSFQGMINYLKRYSAKLTRLFEPLKPLLREEMEWTWDSSHQDAFDAIKEEFSRTPVLAYFDRKAEHVIQTDASMKGLGAILLQEGKPVIYVSRTLTPAEERYSNIERDLLGVVFAMERLHNYVFGEPARVQTSQTSGNDLEEGYCHYQPETSTTSSEACKIRNSSRVHLWEGQLNCRRP